MNSLTRPLKRNPSQVFTGAAEAVPFQDFQGGTDEREYDITRH